MKPAARSMLDLARSRSASKHRKVDLRGFWDACVHVAQYLPAPAQICGRTLSWRRKKDSVDMYVALILSACATG